MKARGYIPDKEISRLSLRDQIVSLEALAAIDAELRRLEEQITEERGILANLKSELRKLDDKLGADRASVAEMDKTRNELDDRGPADDCADRALAREALASRNERESNAAQRELEELRKLHRDREDEINKLATLSEAARKTIDDTESAAARRSPTSSADVRRTSPRSSPRRSRSETPSWSSAAKLHRRGAADDAPPLRAGSASARATRSPRPSTAPASPATCACRR